MKTRKRTIAKYVRLYALCFWGLCSLLYIAGEPVDTEMPSGKFCLMKLIGIISLGICLFLGRRLAKAGLLPDKNEPDYDY